MILSDDPGWRARAQHRRHFCPAGAPWIALAECGWAQKIDELGQLLQPERMTEIWRTSQNASNNYLRATGMALMPAWVFGLGPRAIWPDNPGRWFVAHAANAEIMQAARAHFFGAPAKAEPKILTTHLNGLPTQIVRRAVKEQAATQGDVLRAALAMSGIDPAECFGACAFSPPTMARIGDSNTVATIEDGGLAIATSITSPAGWHDEFRRRQPHTVPANADLLGPRGPIRVERFKWTAMHERAAQSGDTTVPQSPIELAVSFVETVGIEGRECWGIAERHAGYERGSAYAQITYRPRPEHDAGRTRFFAYIESLRISPSDLDVGHPEGYVAMDWGGIKMYRPYEKA